MSWLSDMKLKSKLLIAFGLCALITVAVGMLGQSGGTRLYALFRETVDNNLFCITKVGSVKTNVTATSRNLYKVISLTTLDVSHDELADSISSLRDSQQQVFADFKAYRTAPLDDDERLAGDAFAVDWPIYVRAVEDTLKALQDGDNHRVGVLVATALSPNYRKIMDELKIIIDSNARQAADAAALGVETNSQVTWMLFIGSLLAVISAIALGLIVTRMITKPIYQSMEGASRVARGDLTQSITQGGEDETGQLLKSLADMQANLKTTVQQIASASDQLASAAEELTVVTDDSTRALVRQNDEIQQAATAVNEMTAAAEEVARSAASASQTSARTADEALNGQAQVQQAVSAMDTMASEITDSTLQVEALAGQIRDITQVLEVIRSIAEQTNLLALNAAIEAARAGEQGRGFAVVADEVRALAHRTQVSTGEIESMINTVRKGADEAVQAMGKSQALALNTQSLATQAGLALARISEGVNQMNEQNLVIASAAEEQAQVAREVDRNLVNIQDISAQTAAGANQTSASSQELSHLALSFNTMVGQFKL